MGMIFWDFLILYQIVFSPRVKRSMSISNKHCVYDLPHELPNDLRLSILGNLERLETYSDFIEL